MVRYSGHGLNSKQKVSYSSKQSLNLVTCITNKKFVIQVIGYVTDGFNSKLFVHHSSLGFDSKLSIVCQPDGPAFGSSLY